MRTVCEINMCAGCMACVDICPKNAISIVDDLKTYNAVIDKYKCVSCGLCHQVCQRNNLPDAIKPQYWYQGWAKNVRMRERGASGGFAGAIAEKFIIDGGEVCSCHFKAGEFMFSFARTTSELKQFSGSKYVKSNPSGIYKKIQEKLKDGRRVLFIGLPCQVAAVKNFVGKAYEDNLYTADLICHGTPSPKLLELFLKQYGLSIREMEDIRFRIKGKFSVYQGNCGVITNGVCDKYSIAFLNSLTYTENCYDCRYAREARVSDITLGDSWGSEICTEQFQKGISLALCQTTKGYELLSRADVHLQDVNLQLATLNNQQLRSTSIKPKAYEDFFTQLKRGKNFNSLITKYFPKDCMRQNIKEILIKSGLYRGRE